MVGIKSHERDGYYALQVGASYAKQKALDAACAGFYLSQGVPFKRRMVEFQVRCCMGLDLVPVAQVQELHGGMPGAQMLSDAGVAWLSKQCMS